MERTFELLESLDLNAREEPRLYHDRLFNLAVIGTILKNRKSLEYRKQLERLYEEVTPYVARVSDPSKESLLQAEQRLGKRPEEMSTAETLSLFVAPKEDLRQLRSEISYAEGLKVPTIRRVGHLKYSVEEDLSTVNIKCYAESTLAHLPSELTEGIQILNLEPDLAVFRLGNTNAEIVARDIGVFLIVRPYQAQEETDGEIEKLIAELDRLFFDE